MTLLLRKAAGQPIRDAMKRNGLSAERLAKATKGHDASGRGISTATVVKLAGRGKWAADSCRRRTAELIATALGVPLEELFSMPPVSTDTVGR